jgi:CRP-like cAMP-binding protein
LDLPNHIKSIVNLTSQEEQEISILFQREEFSKGHFLFQEGDICRHIFYIEKGLVRMYHNSDGGKEITAWFSAENSFVTATDSFYQHEPTRHYCVLLEDSIIYSIKYSDLEEMLNRSHAMAKFAYQTIYEVAKKLAEYISDIKFQNAQERYKTLLHDYPLIFQRVQLSYIASYLGITPETLSRLRVEK